MSRLPAASPLAVLCGALPTLPVHLRDVGLYVAGNEVHATTRTMRKLAAAAGADPAAFTRLVQALGHAGWDELRGALIVSRRRALRSAAAPHEDGSRTGEARLAATSQYVAHKGTPP